MAPEGSPSQNPSRDPAGCGPLAFGTLVAAAAAAFFLRGLVGTPALVICSLLAGGSLAAAAAMLLGTLRGVKDRDTRRGSFELAGALVFLTAAAAMLLPLAPASVLPAIPFGTAVLEARDERLRQAVGAGDTDQVRRLASVGLAESAPRHPSGTPLIGLVDDPELLQVLLDAGLDPDIPDAYGRTPLMNSRDPERTRVLLAGGADPETPDDLGRTALMYAASGPIERVEALLEVGASVEARDDLGRYVGDHYGDGHAALPLLQSRARGRLVMSGPGAQDPRTWGRRDWLVVAGGPGEAPGPSVEATSPHPASTLEGPDTPLTFGQTATLTATLVNPGTEPKLLMVEARLNNSAYFVGASHGGRITLPDTAPLDQTIRWPTLSLPEGAVGQIELEIVARRGLDAGDLSVDVEARDLRTNSDPEILSFYSELIPSGETGADGSVLLGWLFLLLPLATLVAWAAAWQRFEPGDPRRRWARRAVALVFATLAGWIAFAGAAAQLR
ncbi:MAG: ankyrin repeat domain-containing protein, partial [Acidobacteriota bacterium]